jgi:predicted amidohydrolase
LPFRQSGFGADLAGWTPWSDRAETAPRTWVDTKVSRGEPGSLAVSGNGNAGAFGGWQRTFAGIEPAAWYRFTVYYRSKGVKSENWQILPRLDWQQGNGRRAGEVDIAYRSVSEHEWTKVSLETQAPDAAANVVVQLFLAHSPNGTVWWDEIGFERIPTPGPRTVTIASVNDRPSQMRSSEESVAHFVTTIDRVVPAHVDLILLPEGITVVGTQKRYSEVAETIPGPTTERLGRVARAHKAYIVAGIYERDGSLTFNTAVLLDRSGKVAGKYRKVHLPREEMEQLTPGDEYPVFQTDFGTIGIMTCYDVFFADPARGLAARGAEIVLLPIWGGDETLAKARAIENQVYLVASGYDHPTYIMSPAGERIALASQRGTAAVATIDLNKNLRQRTTNLGDMRNRIPKEMRVDVPAVVSGPAR